MSLSHETLNGMLARPYPSDVGPLVAEVKRFRSALRDVERLTCGMEGKDGILAALLREMHKKAEAALE